MNLKRLIQTSILLSAVLSFSFPAFAEKTDSKKDKENTEKEASDSTAKKDNYAEAIKDAKVLDGLFTVYQTPSDEILFEVKEKNLSQVFLLTNRITKTNDDAAFAAGQMIGDQIMFRITADSTYVHFLLLNSDNKVRPADEIGEAFFKNHMDPVMKTFKVKACNKEENTYLIDMTSFFKSNEKVITPLQYSSNLMGPRHGSYDAEASKILDVKSFPENVEITSQMNFQCEPTPYLVHVHRSILLLPDKPMPIRYQDNRVGYFSSDYNYYSSDLDQVERREIIHRWRIEPKDDEWDKYFAGELVEPKKPIVYYVDSAFPEKWRSAVLQGIEDWQPAFEAAGFKNAIIAKVYPSAADSTEFDPDDARFNCIRYIATDIANASGPSYVDPRSGEILIGDVNWYHNVISLVNNWRFTQTAAVDPRVRKSVFDDDVMRESLRYVASHEVGHTLGLMHNMGASFSFPVDSLRSPEFTQKYGTTPSIMDYARNNYVAQPGDLEKGVRLVPPTLGVYDIHAIKWGYTLFEGQPDADEERPLLGKIITEHGEDPMYKFGAQQIFATVSPADLTEDLGDDHIKASNYAVSNLKLIVPKLEEWFYKDGRDYMEIKIKYFNVVKQYQRVFGHVLPYLGGVYFNDLVQDGKEGQRSRVYVGKDKQKEAMEWLVGQTLNLKWLLPERIMDITGYGSGDLDSYQRSVVAKMFGASTLTFIAEGERSGQENLYDLDSYLHDAVNAVLVNTRKRRKLSAEDMNMQNAMIAQLAFFADLVKPEAPAGLGSLASIQEEVAENEAALKALEEAAESECFCSHCHDHENEHLTSYFRPNNDLPKLSGALVRPVARKELNRVVRIYKSAAAASSGRTKAFYKYQVDKVRRLSKSTNS